MHTLENFDLIINKWLAIKLNRTKNKVRSAFILRDRYIKSMDFWKKGISR